MTRLGPLPGLATTVETVRGTPIRAYGRTLIPIARVVSTTKHHGTIREEQIEGTGWGVAFVRPLEVIEECNGDLRVLPIPDLTVSVLRQMALIAVVIALVAMALVFANRWAHR